MAKNKTLTIYNSDRYFNIDVKDKSDISDSIKVTRLNEDEIESSLDVLASAQSRYKVKDNNTYMLFNEKYNNDKLIQKVCNHGGRVLYYTDTTVPYYIFKQLTSLKDSAIIYKMREAFTPKGVDNIALSYMGTKVIIDVSVVLPNVNPYDIIRALHPIKTNVDEVHLTFPKLKSIEPGQERFYYHTSDGYELKTKYKLDFAEHLRVSLSVWKMYIYILVDDMDKADIQEALNKMKRSRNVQVKGVN